MTDGKCYSTPPKTAIDHKIDSAFEKAYRKHYMGQNPAQATIDEAYEAAQKRKSQAWRDDLSDDAKSSYRRDLPEPTKDAIGDAYERAQERKRNAWKEAK